MTPRGGRVITIPRSVEAAETRLLALTGRAVRVFDAIGRLVAIDGGSVVYDVASARDRRCNLAAWRARWGAGYRMS